MNIKIGISTLQTTEPKTYSMTGTNEESVYAMKDGLISMKKNVCGKSTSDEVLNLALDICEEKEFQGKDIGLNGMPKVFTDGRLKIQNPVNENGQSQLYAKVPVKSKKRKGR